MMSEPNCFPADLLETRTCNALITAGATPSDAAQTTRALRHASEIGVDSHGFRLVAHYAAMLRRGRVARRPQRTLRRTAPASAMLDAGDGLAHPACYEAMDEAMRLARHAGIGAVGIMRSSHCGAMGAYTLAAAEAGMIGLAWSNSDSNVALHDGARPFHGTNPISMAAPTQAGHPWLLDMASSSIPFNRVRLYRTFNRPLPSGVAADAQGQTTTDPHAAHMLLPLGGPEYGFKGAGLAGMATILSAVLTGAALDCDLLPMTGASDETTPRNVGQFVICIDPDHFVGRAAFEAAMACYLAALRNNEGQHRTPTQAPGDRAWAERARRATAGIPLDPETAGFLGLR